MIDHRLLTLRQMIKHVRNITDIDCMYYDPAVRFSGLNMNVSAIGMSVSIDSSRTSSKVLKMCLNDERLRSDIINDLDVREDLAQTIRNLHQFDENYIGFDGEQAFMQQHYSEYAQQLIAVYSAGNFDYTDVEESLSYLIVKSMSFDNKPSDYAQMVSSGLNGSKRNSLKHRLVRDAYEYTVATKKETKLIECLMENLGLDAGHEDLIEMPSAFHEQMLFYTVSLGESSGFNYLFKIPKEIEQYAHLDKWKAFGLEPEKGKKDINPLLKHAALLYPDTLLKLNSIRELSGISYADAYDIHRAQQITACPLPTLEDAAWMRK